MRNILMDISVKTVIGTRKRNSSAQNVSNDRVGNTLVMQSNGISLSHDPETQ